MSEFLKKGKVFEKNGDFREAGLLYIKAGAFKEALKAFERGEQWLEAGKVAERLKKKGKALDYYTKAAAYAQIAKIHLADGQYEKACENFVRNRSFVDAAKTLEILAEKKLKIKKSPKPDTTLNDKARKVIKLITSYHTEAGNFKDAATWCLTSGDKMQAAQHFMKAGAYVDAAKLFEELSKPVQAARAWEAAGQHATAAKMFSEAGQLEEAAQAYQLAGQDDYAVAAYRRSNQHAKAGMVYKERKHYDLAAKLFEEGKDYLEAAKCYRLDNNLKKSTEVVLKVPKRDKDYSKACLLAIEASIKDNNISFKTDAYIREFLRNPYTQKTIKLFYSLAELYENLEFYENAKEIYEKIALVDADYQDVKNRIESLHLQISGSPMAVRKILEDDYNYRKTSDRLAGYQESTDDENSQEINAHPGMVESIQPEVKEQASLDTLDFNNGSVLFDRFTVKEVISQDSESVLCRVLDNEMEERQFLRCMNVENLEESSLDDYKNDIKKMRKIQQEGVIRIFDLKRISSVLYLAMEEIKGAHY